MDDPEPEKRLRGKGRGSNFFALGPDVWQRLQTEETSNRLNFILTYLVLLAGTGSDHQLTKWSAKACDEHVGLGKPRAKTAIEELIACGLVSRTETSSRMMPQYQLPELPRDADPLFFPIQIVTGFDGEASVLRRIRETGDLMLLILLIDLYGLIETDQTYGVPINQIRQLGEPPARKVSETGVYAVWALKHGYSTQAWQRTWSAKHITKGKKPDWQPLWDRLDALKRIGAIWWETWVFDGDEADAEPLFPVDLGVMSSYTAHDDEQKLTLASFRASLALLADRSHMLDNVQADFFLPLMLHQRAPAMRGVLRLRVEADTPGRRRSYAQRNTAIEKYSFQFSKLIDNVEAGEFGRPFRSSASGGRS